MFLDKPATPPNPHMSVTICLEIIRIHLMRPFFSRSLGVHLPLLPLDLRPLISLYDSLQVHPFRPLQGHCSSSHLLSLLRHQLFPLSGTMRITIQNALISRVLRKRASLDPTLLPGSVAMLPLCLYHTDFLPLLTDFPPPRSLNLPFLFVSITGPSS